MYCHKCNCQIPLQPQQVTQHNTFPALYTVFETSLFRVNYEVASHGELIPDYYFDTATVQLCAQCRVLFMQVLANFVATPVARV